jgi:enamine deaminase RidA (YjgF/YER057c/UK114 family)
MRKSQTKENQSSRQNISSGRPWEALVGYSRAVRVGNLVVVAGTTATNEQGEVVGVGDAYRQTAKALENIEAALQQLGVSRAQVVRTRLYVTDISRWQEYGLAHAEFFGDIRPATSMVEVARLIGPDMLVEVEADAVLE